MTRDVLSIEAGRGAFGADPEAYERARPAYPEAIFDILKDRCGLRAGIDVFEVGPGPGTVSVRLAEVGIKSLTAIEPDARLAAHLAARLAGKTELSVLNTIFEDAALAESAFDLGIAATSFHWVDQRKGIAKVARALKPGAWWACWWNLYGTGGGKDPFLRASRPLFASVPESHADKRGGTEFPMDTEARLADLTAEPALRGERVDIFRWTVTLSADEVRDLYASYSMIATMEADAKARFLDGIQALAANAFGGHVEKPMAAALYTVQRR